MKLYVVVLFIVAPILTAFAQTEKVYVTKDGKYSTDTANASSYVVIQQVADTAFYVRQYNMEDSIMTSGTYRDAQLSVPDGKFIYYLTQQPKQKVMYDYDSGKFDTIKTPRKTYITQAGYYYRGLKNGVWTDYSADGSLVFVRNYKSAKLEGMAYDFYSGTNKVSVVGKYVNDNKDGGWKTLSPQGDTIKTDYFLAGKLKKTVSYLTEDKFLTHVKNGHPDFELDSYLLGKLQANSFSFPNNKRGANISFILTAQGKLTHAIITDVNNFKLDKTLIDVLLKYQNWIPTFMDLSAVQSQIQLSCIFVFQSGQLNKIAYTIKCTIPGYDGY